MKSFLSFLSLQTIHLLYLFYPQFLVSFVHFLFISAHVWCPPFRFFLLLFSKYWHLSSSFSSWSNTKMQQKFSFFVGSIWKSLYGCQPSPVPTPPAEHSYLDNPLMFFKQAPSKVCISIFFSVAFIFAPHLYFAEGNRKAYICVCVGTTGHWHSLSRQHSHSQRGTLLSQPTANLLTNKYKYRKV